MYPIDLIRATMTQEVEQVVLCSICVGVVDSLLYM